MNEQTMKLAPDINPTMKQFWENTREPGEPFCRRCGIPESAEITLQPFELAGRSFHLCHRCQKAVVAAIWPNEAPPAASITQLGPQEPPGDPMIYNRRQADGTFRSLAGFWERDETPPADEKEA